ncbi:MAG: hypothetical protein V4495_22240 [Pseudomonadota bacterium]
MAFLPHALLVKSKISSMLIAAWQHSQPLLQNQQFGDFALVFWQLCQIRLIKYQNTSPVALNCVAIG